MKCKGLLETKSLRVAILVDNKLYPQHSFFFNFTRLFLGHKNKAQKRETWKHKYYLKTENEWAFDGSSATSARLLNGYGLHRTLVAISVFLPIGWNGYNNFYS